MLSWDRISPQRACVRFPPPHQRPLGSRSPRSGWTAFVPSLPRCPAGIPPPAPATLNLLHIPQILGIMPTNYKNSPDRQDGL